MNAKAAMSSADVNDLPDSDFAYIEPGGSKDSEGKTTPRSLRHFPIHDAAHVRNALAQLAKSPFGAKARAKVEAAAKKMGIGEPADESDAGGETAGKAILGHKDAEVKAENLTDRQLESWLAGERSRRIVVVPFYGPLPGGKAGLDLDGEYFDDQTDLYGPFPGLRASRERLVDWHHNDAGVPSGLDRMKGAILGKVVLDAGPSTLTTDEGEFDGVLADFWANAGEKRVALIATLQRRGVKLYGSSEAVAKAVRKAPDGHIDLWPLYRHTITTSPQNTYAVVPPLKAVLAADLSFDEVGLAALRAALVGLGDLSADLHATSLEGERAAKARRLSEALGEAERLLPLLRARAEQSGVPIQ